MTSSSNAKDLSTAIVAEFDATPGRLWNTDTPCRRALIPGRSRVLARLVSDLQGIQVRGADPLDALVDLTQRDYLEVATGGLGVDSVWVQTRSGTGRLLADRARGWGWVPTVDRARALAEIIAGLTPVTPVTP